MTDVTLQSEATWAACRHDWSRQIWQCAVDTS